MKQCRDLQQQTFSCTHTVDFLHAVKDRQCDIRCALDMVFAAGIAFGNVSGSNQNVIFEIVGALDELLLFSVIVGNSIKKRNSRNPDCLCLENVEEIFADDHRRNDQGRILQIDPHLICQCLLCLVYRFLIMLPKLFHCEDMFSDMLLKDRICKKIPHQDHIFDLPVFQIQPLKSG